MRRKLFGIFSGWQITVMFGMAVVVPSALYGAVTTTLVSITDPNNGYKAFVDTTRRLSVYDPIAGYKNNPANSVNVFFNLFQNNCATTYTVPAGKALVVTAISGRNSKSDPSNPRVFFTLIDGINCQGPSVSAGGSSDLESPIATEFGSGIVIKSGSLSIQAFNHGGFAYVHGYLIPDAAAQPSAPNVAASQNDNAYIMAKERARASR